MNRTKYESESLVSFYASQDQLQDVERYVFEKYIAPGQAILDMGVGGGRTTAYLSKNASNYIGADYSNSMIKACKDRFPRLSFVQCDAQDMSQFSDNTFDVVVFSFNGIDVLETDRARFNCFLETSRVLKKDGLFIFSSHNSRMTFNIPELNGVNISRMIWRIIWSFYSSMRTVLRRVFNGVFIKGEGYETDPHHGGMRHYSSNVRTMTTQLDFSKFEVREFRPSKWNIAKHSMFSPWIYYVAVNKKK